MKDLLSQNLVRPDVLFLGLDTAEDGALIDGRGIASDFLYTIGPLRKGNLWETTAGLRKFVCRLRNWHYTWFQAFSGNLWSSAISRRCIAKTRNKNAIRVAAEFAEGKINEQIEAELRQRASRRRLGR